MTRCAVIPSTRAWDQTNCTSLPYQIRGFDGEHFPCTRPLQGVNSQPANTLIYYAS